MSRYELTMPKELAELVEWNAEDPLLAGFLEFAQTKSMDQETVTGLLHMLAKFEYQQEAIDFNTEKAALGDRADERLLAFDSWARENLPEAQAKTVLSALGQSIKPSQVFQAFEALMQHAQAPSTTTSNIPRGDGGNGGAAWESKWYARSDMPHYKHKIDEPGQREIARKELQGIVGSGNHIELVQPARQAGDSISSQSSGQSASSQATAGD